MRFIIILLLAASLGSLAYALTGMLKPGSGDRLQRGLRLRIGFSVAVFLLLLLGWASGLIEPHGLTD